MDVGLIYGLDAAEFVDRVVTVDYVGRGVVKSLYAAARGLVDEPLCGRAAELLSRARGVAVATGFPIIRFGGAPESDGLLSSVLFARWLEERGGWSVLFVDKGFEKIVEAGLKAAGARSSTAETAPHGAGEKTLTRIVEEAGADLLVAVERPGANKHGQYHNSVGENITAYIAPLDKVFEKLSGSGRPFIAVGDGGNEAGMGLIKEAVEKHVPYGEMCRCPCSGGIASATAATHLVVASISDLGLYGAMALADNQAFQKVFKNIRQAAKALFTAGCVDAFRGPHNPGVDGMGLDAVEAVAAILARIGVREK
uniref:D-glutamate cyclase-like C-terminal domain-containing protein n=1 Tax=Caldiarchaeum subterraneum TaxID=311458 RepID=E6N7F7_CALS0|nr:conserved hypothetical protein [Candidatus Caldarchaeum subterraneum]